MNSYPLLPLGDLVRNVTAVETDPLENGLERYVGLEHIEPENLHIKSWGNVADGISFTRKFTKGQTLFGKRRAYQRKVAFAEWDGLCSSDILVLEPQDDRLLPELLPFICQAEGFYQHALGTSAGSLSPRTKWKHLAEYKFPLPPLDEQRRIAEILWAADEVKEKHLCVLTKIQELKSAVSNQFFNPELHNGEFVECAKLCEEITVGIVIQPAKYYVEVGGVPTLRSLNVFPDRFVFEDLVQISQTGHIQNSKSRLRKGDVVVVRTGRPGDASVIPDDLEGYNCIDLIIARPSHVLRSEYLSRYLNSMPGSRQMLRGTAGTAQQHFNVGALKKLRIPYMPLLAQDHIVETLIAIESRIEQLTTHIETLNQLSLSIRKEFLGS